MPVPVAPWTVVVPVKRLGAAKSRLLGPSDTDRADLALAFAFDVVTAALAVPVVREVVVVSADTTASTALAGAGARVVDDPGGGLNAALRRGARAAGPGAVAALTADLPAVRAEHLAAVLALAEQPCCVVDAEGTGTTLLAAPDGRALQPRFGEGSAARHLAAGAQPMAAADGLRRDVDTPADLTEALRLGVGARTTQVALRLGLLAARG